eukprot:NODE_3397_length_2044_cov_9.010955.p1 GENE.NODE_3397_length_2044_cov_9.010955~~NODE_3397_length_2044_cov_9.010955.p1  ORF type:complete len:653 (+),score=199.56 NODE_3397_length_2044_cov_9.010955:185-1960(+)
MLVASSTSDVSFVQNSRPDPLVKGFAEEERDEKSRRKRARVAAASAWGTKQDAEYRFGSIKAEFKYSTPPPYEAEQLLQKLATDPGIIEIMKTRQFKVGVFTEMSPAEAQKRMAQRGTPNMDLLGYNQNHGDMIVLRLRTDNVKGFRPYHDLINTLIHELTHNVWGPHDDKFWKLYGELKAQYMRFHRFWSHNGSTTSGAQQQFAGFDSDGEGDAGAAGGFGQILGGARVLTETERRARATLAAEVRAVVGALESTASQGLCGCGQCHDAMVCPVCAPSDTAATGATAEVDMLPTEAPSALPAAVLTEGALAATLAIPEPPPMARMPEEVSAAAVPGIMVVAVAEDSPTATTPAVAAAGAVATTAAPEPAAVVAAPAASTDGGVGVVAAMSSAPTKELTAVVEVQASETASVPAAEDAGGPAAGIAAANASTAVAATAAAAVAAAVAAELPAPTIYDAPPLDGEDLTALGLDATAEWVGRFSSQSAALCSPGRHGGRRAVEILLKIARNASSNRQEKRFRRVRVANPQFQQGLLGAGAEAETLLKLLGFEPMTEAGESIFLLRDAAFDTVRLRLGQDLLEQRLNAEAVTAH